MWWGAWLLLMKRSSNLGRDREKCPLKPGGIGEQDTDRVNKYTGHSTEQATDAQTEQKLRSSTYRCLFSSTVLFVPRDLYSTSRLGRSHAELFCHRVPRRWGWAASSSLLGKGEFGGGFSVVRRKCLWPWRHHQAARSTAAPSGAKLCLRRVRLQPGFPGDGTTRRDPELRHCTVPGTAPVLQTLWDPVCSLRWLVFSGLRACRGRNSKGRAQQWDIPGKVRMPGDSDQDLLLPTDMAEDTEMSVFGMRSLWNRMGKHKIKKTTSSSSL